MKTFLLKLSFVLVFFCSLTARAGYESFNHTIFHSDYFKQFLKEKQGTGSLLKHLHVGFDEIMNLAKKLYNDSYIELGEMEYIHDLSSRSLDEHSKRAMRTDANTPLERAMEYLLHIAGENGFVPVLIKEINDRPLLKPMLYQLREQVISGKGIFFFDAVGWKKDEIKKLQDSEPQKPLALKEKKCMVMLFDALEIEMDDNSESVLKDAGFEIRKRDFVFGSHFNHRLFSDEKFVNFLRYVLLAKPEMAFDKVSIVFEDLDHWLDSITWCEDPELSVTRNSLLAYEDQMNYQLMLRSAKRLSITVGAQIRDVLGLERADFADEKSQFVLSGYTNDDETDNAYPAFSGGVGSAREEFFIRICKHFIEKQKTGTLMNALLADSKMHVVGLNIKEQYLQHLEDSGEENFRLTMAKALGFDVMSTGLPPVPMKKDLL